MTNQTSLPISATPIRGVERAEIVFSGVELAGPSWEGRVYVNNPAADESTAQDPASGYAGSFYVYGYGEPAPPGVAEARARGDEAPIAPVEQRVQPDPEVLRAAAEKSEELTITVVPVPTDPSGASPERAFEQVDVVVDPAR